MAPRTTGETWPERLAADIGGQVKRLRERPEWSISAQTLANLTADLGHEVARSVIANLESGRRANMPLADVLVLAQALRVPPGMLVFPLGRFETVEALPGRAVDTSEAVRWWDGQRRPLVPVVDKGRVSDAEQLDGERESYGVHDLFLHHWHLIDEIRSVQAWAKRATSKDRWMTQLDAARAELEEVRGEMVRRGLVLPVLDGEGADSGNGK
ncbi:hypothetical protein [Rhodococcus globerulus]|uniref:hypothetical protein n=1 Tax=Rhodococcus globerulus TaxID=33008 RepID=UPI00301A7A76